jgi:hypothetical protein
LSDDDDGVNVPVAILQTYYYSSSNQLIALTAIVASLSVSGPMAKWWEFIGSE